ncbi:class I SAM-dependent methyltransferase [Deinococcus cellulosilyticus]|uniref:Class I SAM-dependent methyltransferase n=1 Tax=Deinococcus cellulosilyticus (strain DSM 18568 / NBRC 106333 / KACC 11606 / 5516J-15) TaxID=1223518 RepID=A0A511N4F2_DEIC1|nr:class I SAM-dependent methyltransferase [Deinococcus cellulosilyticus]GEM47358.1 hypothetical protein DC3_29930 [Deinococcus cellulosilyticus NBRC 106333 = KACC 11606]
METSQHSAFEATLPHSREWYQALASNQGQYAYPWKQVLSAPGGEDWFSHLLEQSLSSEKRVLEAGCAHAPDARRFAHLTASWTGYDWMEGFLVEARKHVPGGHFVCWDGKSDVPDGLKGAYDVLVSRRGPTSFLNHIKTFAAPGAHMLCVYPTEDIRTKVLHQLEQVQADVLGEWTFRTRGFLPEFQDFLLYQRWHGDSHSEAELEQTWDSQATPAGFPILEERYVVQARMG